MKLKNIFFIIVLLFFPVDVYARRKRKERKQYSLRSSQDNNVKKPLIPVLTQLPSDSPKSIDSESQNIEVEKVEDIPLCQDNGAVPCYSGGRFGDNLLAFAHALYFAIKNKLTLYYVPFTYSEQLLLDDSIPKFTSEIEKRFKDSEIFSSRDITVKESVKSTLFTIPYFPEANIWDQQIPFFVDWDDNEFKNSLTNLIKPKFDLWLIEPPEDKISIALHVRKGGSWSDESELSQDVEKLCLGNLIYKIPLDNYYINQIKIIAELFKDKPLYIFLFTDDQNPQVLIDKYKELVDIPGIEFDCRKEENDHCFNVLEDFFSMMNFDVLIRPESNFSIMAEKLGNHSIVISPGRFLRNSRIQAGLITIKEDLVTIKRKKI